MKIFTTTQAAKAMKVTPKTVSRWCDSGRLRHYRIPGTMDRRIIRENLIEFAEQNGIPTDNIPGIESSNDEERTS